MSNRHNSDPEERLEIRQIKLANSGQDGDTTFLVNSDIESRGLVIITLGDILVNENQSKCNIRILPFAKFKELLQPPRQGDKHVRLSLAFENIIKLDVTLEYTALGEVQYKLHRAEVEMENMDMREVEKWNLALEHVWAEKVVRNWKPWRDKGEATCLSVCSAIGAEIFGIITDVRNYYALK